MGLLDTIENLAGQAAASREQAAAAGPVGQGETAKVAGGLVQALQEHPGGLQGVMQTLEQNGMGQHAQAWANGQETPVSPQQVQQGLGGSGLLESVAERAGVSPEVAKIALATVLPMVMAHFSNGGRPVAENEMGGMVQGLMSRFL